MGKVKNKRIFVAMLSLCFLFCLYSLSLSEEKNDGIFIEWARLTMDGKDHFAESEYAINTFSNKYYRTSSSSIGGYAAHFLNEEFDNSRFHVSGDYTYYTLDDGTIALLEISYKHQTSKIEIPSSIDGYTVSRLGLDTDVIYMSNDDHRYFLSEVVKEVVIPDTIEIIGANTLSKSNSKKIAVNFPDSVKKIGCMFWNTNLKKVVLPNSLEVLGNFAFTSMSIKSLKLPSTLKEIGMAAFMETDLGEVSFPGTIEKIGSYTCCNIKRLQKVTMKEGFPYISEGMFMACKKLKSIQIPSSVTRIESDAFSDCASLKTVSFANESSLKQIGEGAFRRCGVTKIILPDGLESIDNDAFFGCEKLASVTIPSTVVSIGDYSFDMCSKKLVLTVTEGSYAEEWAKKTGIETQIAKK